MKYILVIGDGMADDPIAELDGKTPLEYANIPYIDSLAAKGEMGQVKNCPEGLPAGSDTAILSILGFDPRTCYSGRSPLEAAAQGIVPGKGDVSYRCNLVTLENGNMLFHEKKLLSHSADSIEGDKAIALMDFLMENSVFSMACEWAGISFHTNPSFRQIALQMDASIEGMKLIPPHEHLGEPIGPILPSGSANAMNIRDLMEMAYALLDYHPINMERRQAGKMPANGIWFWAEGTGIELESFQSKFGHKGAMISAVPLCQGIARLSGMDVIEVEGATGELETNYEGKVQAALDALKGDCDFVAIHVEAPDECTHNGDTKGKIQAIENLDSRVLQPLTQALDAEGTEYRLLFISDHKTLTSTRGHDAGAVPYLIYDSRKDTGLGLPFCEASAAQGPSYEDGAAVDMKLLFEQI